MSKEKIESSPSPLARRKLTLGATPPPVTEQEEPELKHKDVETPKHKDVKTPGENSPAMRRTTIYMPEDLAVKLKVYAARHRQDVSGIITKQMEKFLAAEEE